MVDTTPEQVMHRLRWLPAQLREAYESTALDDTIRSIATAWKFSDETRDKLFRVMGDVFLAFIHPDKIASEIQEALGIEEAAADLLSRQMEKQVFGQYLPLIESYYSPPRPVPQNSPIYAVSGADADKYLDSALRRVAEVEGQIVGHHLSAGRSERNLTEPVMSRSMHDHLRKLLDIAVAEVAYAESLDPDMVVFLSDDEFLNDDGVRRVLFVTTAKLDQAAGMYASESDFIDRALSIREDFGLHMVGATANAVLGEFEAAVKHARRAIELSPNNDEKREAQEFLHKLLAAKRQVRIRQLPGVHILDEHRKYLSDEDIASIYDVLLIETDRPVRTGVLLVKGPRHDYVEIMLFDTDKISQDVRHVVATVFVHKKAPGRWAPGLRPSRPELAVSVASAPAPEVLYYVHTKSDEMTYGPVTRIMVQEWLNSRCLLYTDMICVVGASEWLPIQQSSLAL